MPASPRVRLFAAASVAAILWLTLTPALREGAHPVPSPWCFRCSDGDSVDVLLNILLFIPCGTALAWLGVRRLRAVGLAAGLTVAIEITQFFFIPGRDGSIRDVLCNTLGAVLGFSLAPHWMAILLPGKAGARRALAGALGLWIGLALIASWALGGTVPPGEWWVQLDPHGLGSADFPGRLLSAELDGTGLVNGRLPDPSTLKTAIARHDVRNSIRLTSGGPVVGTAPVFGLVTGEPVEVLRLSQRDDDALYRFDVRGYRAGLAVPVFGLAHTFGQVAPDTIEWRTSYDGRRIRLEAIHSTGLHQHSEVAITPNQGWQLFWPFEPRRPGQAVILTMLWAAALPLIAAYYSVFQVNSAGSKALVLGIALLMAGLVFPILFGIAAATPLEVLASLSGAAMGWSGGTIVKERL